MAKSNADRNLLLGVLALQAGLISREQLVAGVQAWLRDKTRSLADILRDLGAFDEASRAKLDAVVDHHLQHHAGDPREGLQAVSSVKMVHEELAQLGDTEVLASLGHLAMKPPPSAGASSGTRFLFLRPHAKGGVGEVSVALDTELDREVALKEIQLVHADKLDWRASFLQEARITGSLEHPGIVPIYGLGTYPDGRPFYAMRLVRGESMVAAIRQFHENPQGSDPERSDSDRTVALHNLLRKLIDVCNALQFAHDHGIVHRDIKPGNIMLGSYGETFVVDWGLARVNKERTRASTATTGIDRSSALDDDSTLRPSEMQENAESATGPAMGTPVYMSPEQANGKHAQIGPPSDIYSLGATLYSLLTGRMPIEGPIHEILEKACAGDIVPPRQIVPTIDPALEAICMKAMRFRPEDRYHSMQALASDLERWLAGEPISAWPEPTIVKLQRWISRHRSLVTGAAAVILAALPLLTLLFLSSEAAREGLKIEQGKTATALGLAIKNERLADRRRAEAVKLADANRQLARSADERRQKAETLAVQLKFERAFRQPPDQRALTVLGLAELLRERIVLGRSQSLRESLDLHFAAELEQVHPLTAILQHRHLVEAVAFSPDGTKVLTGSLDRTAQLWEVASGKPIGPALLHTDWVQAVGFSPDGKTMLTASQDRTARLWNTATGEPIGQPLRHKAGVNTFAFSRDGRKVLTGSYDNTARLWDAATGIPIGMPLSHQANVVAVAFSPDGRTALTAGWDHTARLWDTTTTKPVGLPMRHQFWVVAVDFSPDGRLVLTGSHDKTAHLWDAATGKPIGASMPHDNLIDVVRFSPDGKTVLTASRDHSARLWDADTGSPIGIRLQHQGSVKAARFSPDGATILTGSEDQNARLWHAATGRLLGPPLPHQADVVALAFNAAGDTIITGSRDKTARLWKMARQRLVAPLLPHSGPIQAVAFSPDGKIMLTASRDKTARLWDATTGKPTAPPLEHLDAVTAIAFSCDGRFVVTGSDDNTARLWDAITGKPTAPLLEHQGPILAIAVSPDGKTVLTGSRDKSARLWDSATGKPVGAPLQHQGSIRAVAFHPNGQYVLTASEDQTARLWETATGKPIGLPVKHQHWILSAAFSPDGTTFATTSADQTARLWDTATLQPIGAAMTHSERVVALAFHPAGKMLATSSYDKSAHRWEASTGKPIGLPLQHQGYVTALAFSPDGKSLVTASHDRTVRRWESATGAPLGPPFPHRDTVLCVAFSPDGGLLLSGTADKSAQRWRIPDRIVGDAERILLGTELITGQQTDEQGNATVLGADAWHQHRTRLDKLGGPPFR